MVDSIFPIVNGQELNASVFKEVVAPYGGQILERLYYLENLNKLTLNKGTHLRNISSNVDVIASKLIGELEKDKQPILERVTLETGSPIRYHGNNLETVESFLADIPAYTKSAWGKDFYLEPKGKVLIILSANEPLILSTIPVLTALFLGNTVLLKPSSKTPFFSFYLTKKLYELGLTNGLLDYIPADKKLIKSLLKARLVNTTLSFANSETNKELSSDAAMSSIEISVENEGNDWVYIDKSFSYSLQELAKILVGSITKHNGQMCDSIRGLLIHQAVYEDLTGIIKNLLSNTRCGNPIELDSDVGALLEGTLSPIESFIKQNSPSFDSIFNYIVKGNTITPTLIFLNKSESLSLFEKPLFGPVAWIKKVTDFTEALSLYKQHNKHGLCFSIFTSDDRLVDIASKEIGTGTLNINCDPVNPSIKSPWGGIGLSGNGGPLYWADRFVNRKVIKHG